MQEAKGWYTGGWITTGSPGRLKAWMARAMEGITPGAGRISSRGTVQPCRRSSQPRTASNSDSGSSV